MLPKCLRLKGSGIKFILSRACLHFMVLKVHVTLYRDWQYKSAVGTSQSSQSAFLFLIFDKNLFPPHLSILANYLNTRQPLVLTPWICGHINFSPRSAKIRRWRNGGGLGRCNQQRSQNNDKSCRRRCGVINTEGCQGHRFRDIDEFRKDSLEPD